MIQSASSGGTSVGPLLAKIPKRAKSNPAHCGEYEYSVKDHAPAMNKLLLPISTVAEV